MKSNSVPQGVVTVVGFKQRTPNKINVVADLVLKDEAGQMWRVSACRFVSDLKPFCDAQELEFTGWVSKVREGLKWSASNDLEAHFSLYMEGLTVEEATARLNEA